VKLLLLLWISASNARLTFTGTNCRLQPDTISWLSWQQYVMLELMKLCMFAWVFGMLHLWLYLLISSVFSL